MAQSQGTNTAITRGHTFTLKSSCPAKTLRAVVTLQLRHIARDRNEFVPMPKRSAAGAVGRLQSVHAVSRIERHWWTIANGHGMSLQEFFSLSAVSNAYLALGAEAKSLKNARTS